MADQHRSLIRKVPSYHGSAYATQASTKESKRERSQNQFQLVTGLLRGILRQLIYGLKKKLRRANDYETPNKIRPGRTGRK